MKKTLICAALCLSIASMSACNAPDEVLDQYIAAQEKAQQQFEDALADQESIIESMFNKNEEPSEKPVESAQPTASQEMDTKEPPADTEHPNQEPEQVPADKTVESVNYEIAGANFFFSPSVNDDVTGKWRISRVNTSMPATDYALEYYKTLFLSDDEVHGIINFATNTTVSLTASDTGLLFVTVHEHVDKEELSAKELFCGAVLEDYIIDVKTGEVEDVTE